MAPKLIQHLRRLAPFGGIHHYLAGAPGPSSFAACRCAQRRGCGKPRTEGGTRNVTTVVRGGSFAASSYVGLHRDSELRFRLTQLHPPSAEEERGFRRALESCSTSPQVLKLLRSVEVLSDGMAAASLHRVADLEREGPALRDPSLLEQDVVRALCYQLEQDAERLTEAGLVSALHAGTRLFLDPRSPLMARLLSESQRRLGRGRMTAGDLCTLGQAALAMEGPGSGTLERAVAQIQNQEPSRWSLPELTAVYGLLEACGGEDGKYGDLLNAMHSHAATVTSRMEPAAVSAVLSCLVALNQTQALPLVIGLCKQAVRHVSRFSDEELNCVLAALIHFGHSDRYFVEAMEKHVPAMAFTGHPETVAAVAQFFGHRRVLSPAVFDAVAGSFVYRADGYTTGQIARQIAAFGKLGYLPPNASQLFRKVETVLQTRFSQFQPRTLLDLLLACVLVGRFPVNHLSKVFSSYFLQQLQDEDVRIERAVLAQLTQLYMTMKLECPSYEGPQLLPKYRVKSFLASSLSLESPVDQQLYNSVKAGLVDLFGARSFFGSKVLTPYCYTLDVEVKLDEDGYVLPANQTSDVYKRIALCIDGQKRFTTNVRQLLGKEAIKRRHLQLLGYEVVQIPFYEFEELNSRRSVVEYLHQKIFPHTFRLSW